MAQLPVPVWIVLGLWNLVIVYVFVAVRKVMANNNAAIEKVFGSCPFGISDRAVLINRIALAVLMVVSNWAAWRAFGA